MELIGWVDIDNNSGKDFNDVSIKLMAGDINKVQQPGQYRSSDAMYMTAGNAYAGGGATVQEKTFDEYHLYNLTRKVNLLDRENKQVEFVRASNVKASRFYVYDGVKLGDRYRGYDYYSIRTMPEYGIECNKKVWTMVEIKNSQDNNLGIPLPKGDVKIYRLDDDGRNEFIGEDKIDHTAKDETMKIYMGNAFDIAGERKRTNFKLANNRDECEETFEITLRNHKSEKAVVRVVEHLYRWNNWEISENSDLFKKLDSNTIEFRAELEPDKEKVITYKVKYDWK
jgi:hypothetical protein